MARSDAEVVRKAETIMAQADKISDRSVSFDEFVIVSKKFSNIFRLRRREDAWTTHHGWYGQILIAKLMLLPCRRESFRTQFVANLDKVSIWSEHVKLTIVERWHTQIYYWGVTFVILHTVIKYVLNDHFVVKLHTSSIVS